MQGPTEHPAEREQCLREPPPENLLATGYDPSAAVGFWTHLGTHHSGGAGLIDWQLMCHGHYMHDVGYYIQTALGLGDPRQHEKALIRYYLDRLRQAGVARPRDFEEAWTAYRCICAWNIYVGWLPADIDNYGWEICELAHLCVMTAYEAWETAQAIAALDGARLS